VKLAQGVLMGRLEQNRDSLHPDQTLRSVLTGGHGDMVEVAGKPRHVVNYLQEFLFSPLQAMSPVKTLSGGERARLLLAKLFATPSNLLVLDEPTNDLDLETLDLLEEVIADYPGTALIVSHDRDFLDRVATGVVMAEGEGRFQEYAGGYSDMLAQRGQGVTARTAVQKSKSEKTAAPRVRATRAKMNFADVHDLKILPGRIAAQEKNIADLEQSLSDHDLYARDPGRFNALSHELGAVRAAKHIDEERWLALELEREALEQGGE
jgi:ATP-binding cassette subfamily F protein uup